MNAVEYIIDSLIKLYGHSVVMDIVETLDNSKTKNQMMRYLIFLELEEHAANYMLEYTN